MNEQKLKNKILKVLFIGLGGAGQRHLRNLYTALDGKIDVYAIRYRNSQFVLNDNFEIQDCERLDDKYQIKLVSSVDEAYEKGIRVVFICNPTAFHHEFLKSAVKCGMDVFIEKPLSDSVEYVRELLLMNGNERVFIGYQFRYHPCIQMTKKVLSSGAIGKVVSANFWVADDIRNWHPYEDYRNLYASRKEMGGGVILTQIHEIDYIRYLLGKPASIYAVAGHFSNLEVDVEDVANIMFIYGGNGHIVPIHLYEDYLQSPSRRGGVIIGDNGKIEFDLISFQMQVFSRSKECQKYVFKSDMQKLFIEELKEFLRMVFDDLKCSPIPLKEGIEDLEIVDSIKKSAVSGVPELLT